VSYLHLPLWAAISVALFIAIIISLIGSLFFYAFNLRTKNHLPHLDDDGFIFCLSHVDIHVRGS